MYLMWGGGVEPWNLWGNFSGEKTVWGLSKKCLFRPKNKHNFWGSYSTLLISVSNVGIHTHKYTIPGNSGSPLWDGEWKRDPLKGLLVTSNQRMKRSLWITWVICFSFYQQVYKSLFRICVYLWFHFFQPSKKIKQANQTIRYSEHLSVSRSVARNDFNRCWRQSMTLWRLAFFVRSAECNNEHHRGEFSPQKVPWLLGTIEVTDHFDHADLWDHSKKVPLYLQILRF